MPRDSSDKLTSGNFFRCLASRGGWGGFLRLSWTLRIDTVKHQLEVRKPVVITSQDLKLERGGKAREDLDPVDVGGPMCIVPDCIPI